jgi:hypothetical protein
MSTDEREVTYDQVVTITARMAEDGATAKEVAYAVEKPWKHLDWLDRTDLDG